MLIDWFRGHGKWTSLGGLYFLSLAHAFLIILFCALSFRFSNNSEEYPGRNGEQSELYNFHYLAKKDEKERKEGRKENIWSREASSLSTQHWEELESVIRLLIQEALGCIMVNIFNSKTMGAETFSWSHLKVLNLTKSQRPVIKK